MDDSKPNSENFENKIIEVCSECGRACCVQGVFMCFEARNANIKKRTVKDLRLQNNGKGNEESEEYWSDKTFKDVYGDPAPDGYEENKIHDKKSDSLRIAKVILPRELTAENGAKALFSGEFFEVNSLTCVACDENGINHAGDKCDICLGSGTFEEKTAISWDSIKDIYKKIVEHLEVS